MVRLPSVLRRGLTLLMVCCPVWTWSQVLPSADVIPSAQQLKQGRDAALSTSVGRDAVSLPSVKESPRELGKPIDEFTVDVVGYEVDGLNEVPRAELAKLTARFVGKARSYEDMVDAAAEVSRYMQRELGYYLGHAYLPEQDPKDGVIRIAVMEGRLDQVLLQWPDGMLVERDVVERYLASLRPGEILRVRDVERVVFLVNDLQGIRARFEVKAGRTPGTASLLVTPQSEPRYSGRVELDTNGSRFSGTNRGSVLVASSSPTGQGDGVVVNALQSEGGGLSFVLASYVRPVGGHGLKVGGSISQVHYQLDKNEFPMNLNGSALAINAFGLYPMIRSRNLNVFGLLTYEHKNFDDLRFEVSDQKSSDDLQLGVVGDFRDNLLYGGVNTYELSWLQGHLNFANAVGSTPTRPQFGKFSMGYSRLQNVLSNRLLMYLRYKAQWSNTNLDSTERFSLGGPTGVRGFAPGEATGDDGQLLTAELRFLPPDGWLDRASREVVFSAFYDWGQVRFRHDASAEGPQFVNSARLSSAGLGATWERAQVFGLRLNVSWPISGEAQNDQAQRVPRAFATLTKYF